MQNATRRTKKRRKEMEQLELKSVIVMGDSYKYLSRINAEHQLVLVNMTLNAAVKTGLLQEQAALMGYKFPTGKQLSYAYKLAQETGCELTEDTLISSEKISRFIEEQRKLVSKNSGDSKTSDGE
jgi:hypothetical protein